MDARGSRALANHTNSAQMPHARNEGTVVSAETNQPRKAVLDVDGVLYDQLDDFFGDLDILEPRRKYTNYLPIFSKCLGASDVNELLLALRSMGSDTSGSPSIPKMLGFIREERTKQSLNPDEFPIPQFAILSLIYTKLEKAALESEIRFSK
jgi:hypothetical protein